MMKESIGDVKHEVKGQSGRQYLSRVSSVLLLSCMTDMQISCFRNRNNDASNISILKVRKKEKSHQSLIILSIIFLIFHEYTECSYR